MSAILTYSLILYAPTTARTQLSTMQNFPRNYARCAEQVVITATHSALPTTAHCSLLTANPSFTFSAKERDSETGLSYFGSRYYSSDLSIWLSVDPMSDKYASLSPYVYCADNPVKLVDPNGEEIVISTSMDENGNKNVNL